MSFYRIFCWLSSDILQVLIMFVWFQIVISVLLLVLILLLWYVSVFINKRKKRNKIPLAICRHKFYLDYIALWIKSGYRWHNIETAMHFFKTINKTYKWDIFFGVEGMFCKCDFSWEGKETLPQNSFKPFPFWFSSWDTSHQNNKR